MRTSQKQALTLLLFCAPALLVHCLFKLYPALSGLFYALTDWNGLNASFDVIGLDNFVEILSDRYFGAALLFTFKYVLVIVLVSNAAALTLALAIESRRKARGLFRTIFYMPNMISMVIGAYMWNFIFTKVVYYAVDHWGWTLLDHSWIGDARYSFIAIVVVATWGSCGYLMIIYIAALQSVPANLKEAAAIDGAGRWQSFSRIVWPLIRPALTVCVFWSLNSGFQVFDVIYALTGGGPGRATQSVAMNIYEEAFKGNIRYGYATAKSTVLFLLVCLVTLVQLKLSGRKEQEL